MRGRVIVLVALVMALPALSGCLSFLDKDKDGKKGDIDPADVGYDPASIRVTSVTRQTATVSSFDGTDLAVVAYEPKSSDLTPDGEAPAWGTVIFVHGWGFFKETYEGAGGATQTPLPEDQAVEYSVNRLQAFAENGLVAIAYDARGFGQSGGVSTIAGSAELADLEAIRAWAEQTFRSNGLFGVVGVSYGGGHAFQAWVDNPRITTVVPMYGWVDLYQGLAPGNVPKAEWAAMLGGVGVAGTKGSIAQNPMLVDWYTKAVQRSDLDSVKGEMGARSVAGRMSGITKPLFTCQGMQESLFPQIDLAWQQAGGFTRAYVFTGGHGTMDPVCWERTLAWFRYFLGGFDTGVDAWPALESVDANGGRAVHYATFPASVPTTFYLDGENLEQGYPSNATFEVTQNLVSNPLQEPSGLWDQVGMPVNPVPEQFVTDDPTVSVFSTAPITRSEVLLGAPELVLRLADPDAAPAQLQVTAKLIHVTGDEGSGRARTLTRAAYAAVDEGDVDNGTITLRFHWVKADLAPGDRLMLAVGANDQSWFLPLLANYSVEFRGTSELHVPFFQG